jgi:hypothetical protein
MEWTPQLVGEGRPLLNTARELKEGTFFQKIIRDIMKRNAFM